MAQPGEAINELKSGQVEGVVLEKAIAKGYVDQNSDLTMSDIALKSDSNDAYAVAMLRAVMILKPRLIRLSLNSKKKVKLTAMFKMPTLFHLRVLANQESQYEEILVYAYSPSCHVFSCCM